MELDLFCQLFYASHYIPMALLQKGEIQKNYSSLERPLPLYGKVLEQAKGFSGVCKVVSTEDLGLYGLVDAGAQTLLLGPVFSQPVTEKMVSIFARQNGIGNRDWSVLYWLLAGVPRYTYNQFSNLLRCLDFTLNGRVPPEGAGIPREIAAASQPETVKARLAMRSPYEERRHETFRVENMILATVRDGDVEALEHLLETLGKVANLREGQVAQSPLRQAKNIFLGLVCMVGKTAAIPGGMDDEEAYSLIDLYAQECEQAPTVEAVKLLQYNMLLDFTQRVAREKLPPHLSPEMTQCVQFLRGHLFGTVGIDEAAGWVGKSRAWLTRKFKEEMGQSFGEFQAYLRTQEAKRLLRYTDISLSEIAGMLGFSSQAYFHSFFKKAVGMTPSEFRKQ